jgi:hypothetical protein
MKKNFLFLLVAVIAISSCKKSSSSNNNSIVGNWELASAHMVSVDSTASPVTVTTQDTTIAHGHSEVLSFFADNTLTEYDFITTPATIQDSGNYIVVGDSLTIFNSGSTTGTTVHFTIGGNVLTFFINQHNSGTSSTSITEKLNRLQ